MKKFKVIWYEGNVTEIQNILKEKETQANNIDEVNFLEILPKKEKDCFKANIKYCIRVIFLKEDKIHTVDYGSYSKFI